MTTDPTRPKIIVDEDWKSQVQAEKERRQSTPAPSPPEPSTSQTGAPEPARSEPVMRESAEATGAASAESSQLPPATFEFLISSLATQAMIALGQMPDPFTHNLGIHLDLAQHHIDLLQMLESKTNGQLTPDESQLLQGFLYQLRMMFVEVRRQHLR